MRRLTIVALGAVLACSPQTDTENEQPVAGSDGTVVVIEAEAATGSSMPYERISGDSGYVDMSSAGWLSYDVDIPVAGRYRVQVYARAQEPASVWLEDYYDNPDDRT